MTRGRQRLAVGAIAALAGVLLFANLGNQYLWQDEAQTALIAQTILTSGVPLGYDGRNHFSQELGIEYGENHVWRWHTWLPFYLVAASLELGGASSGAARFPFALFGLATLVLTFAVGRRLWRDPGAGLLAMGLLATSVPFLVLCRQARWYSMAAFFSLLGLASYHALERGRRLPGLVLFASATLLFHTHHLYFGTLLLALFAHALLADRRKLAPLAVVAAGATLFNLPWIVWLSGVRYADNYGTRLLDLGLSLSYVGVFVRRLAEHVFDPLFLLIPLLLVAWRWREGSRAMDVPAATRNALALLASYCVVTVLALAFLAPGPYFRYLTPLIPPLFLLLGLLVMALLRRSRIAGVAVLVVWLAANSLDDFLYEITHDFDGPIEGIVRFLQQRAEPDDLVAISYGDLPVKFHTGLRVIGGPTGEDLSELPRADWIVLRHHVNESADYRRVRDAMLALLSPEHYDRFEIDTPDTPFENREDPAAHRFRSATEGQRVQIFKRKP